MLLPVAVRLAFVASSVLLLGIALGACSGEERPPPIGEGLPTAGGGGTGSMDGGSAGSGGLISVPEVEITEILIEEPPCDSSRPELDLDNDGWTGNDGDCNDCTLLMNPGAYDYPGNGVDEDCSGTPDDEPICTETAEFDSADPYDAAAALGLCRRQEGESWGLIEARYTLPNDDGTMARLSHGLLSAFGANVSPQAGNQFLVLSSGTARTPGDPGYFPPVGAHMGSDSRTPPGYPIPAPACPGIIPSQPRAIDGAALELRLRVPTNASRAGFDFNFFTYEFPEYICSEFNDFFVALVDPEPEQALLGNISFDSQGNPVSVNNGFLEVCEPQVAGGKDFSCVRGTSELLGTGFDGVGADDTPHAATGWLETITPVEPGAEIRVRFAIWDAGDANLDSTVLIDRFQWDVGAAGPPVTRPSPR